MSESAGFIGLYRKIQNHWLWRDPVKLKCWIDILLTVNYQDNPKVNLGFVFFECKRGQSLLSYEGWGKRWGMSKDQARNFLKLLEKDKMIKLENIVKSTRLTVCNYGTYQESLHSIQTQSKRKPNAFTTQPHTNNNDNKEINKNYRSYKHLSLSFEDFDKLILEGYSKIEIDTILDKIENYRKNTTYTSLFLTAKNWLKKEKSSAEKENPESQSRQHLKQHDDYLKTKYGDQYKQ